MPKATTGSLAEFRIAETPAFSAAFKRQEYAQFYWKITGFAYPQLRRNPFYGPNIKRLKGELKELYRYCFGGYRLFYTILIDKRFVVMTKIAPRKDSYRSR